MSYTVIFYEKADGSCPVREFLDDQPAKMRAKLLRGISYLESEGNNLREPYSKFLKDGIFELRVSVGNDETRILYFFINGKNIVLTNAFVKKTQKTPSSYIKQAKEYRDDYMNTRREET
ncbi:MAG: type II toxin-antitoxin system RelE/ParE family toxin [Clostridia bacterium]|nr:type II toxin-antitoxin system RelE/ParE family toxin [Clostridia bacterium]